MSTVSFSQDIQYFLCLAGLQHYHILTPGLGVHENLRRGECDKLAAHTCRLKMISLSWIILAPSACWRWLTAPSAGRQRFTFLMCLLGSGEDFAPTDYHELKWETGGFGDWNAAVIWGLMGGRERAVKELVKRGSKNQIESSRKYWGGKKNRRGRMQLLTKKPISTL